ncbi:MAG: hypothetical protein D6762_09980 [Candidatus Neomarinimicrobiota bacterium]|nr:MAG: hypothetical protein D6762_09980 [Candidatus Neomarinimicrobiota bacterium]
MFLIPLQGQSPDPGVTLDKQRLVVLPVNPESPNAQVEETIAALVASEATRLNRFVILDRNTLEPLLEEQALQLTGLIRNEDLVRIGEIAGAEDALLVRVTNFGQKGVPPEEESTEEDEDESDGLFSWVVKKSVKAIIAKELEGGEQYPHNIQTVLQGEVRKIHLETGETLASFPLDVEHTGGTKSASLSKVLQKARRQISRELRNLYVLTSSVVDVQSGSVTLLLGSNLGIRTGTLFELSTPEREKTYGTRTIRLPGRSVGLVQTVAVSPDANQARILRSWAPIQPGYKATEVTVHPVGLSMALEGSLTQSYFLARFSGDFQPFQTFRFGGGISLGSVLDSWESPDFLFQLDGTVGLRLLQVRRFTSRVLLQLPFTVAFRNDDAGHTVSLPIFSPRLGVEVTWMLSPHRDLILSVATAPTSLSSQEWKYTVQSDNADESVTQPAEWNRGTGPDISLTGIYLSVGYRFLLF